MEQNQTLAEQHGVTSDGYLAVTTDLLSSAHAAIERAIAYAGSDQDRLKAARALSLLETCTTKITDMAGGAA